MVDRVPWTRAVAVGLVRCLRSWGTQRGAVSASWQAFVLVVAAALETRAGFWHVPLHFPFFYETIRLFTADFTAVIHTGYQVDGTLVQQHTW